EANRECEEVDPSVIDWVSKCPAEDCTGHNHQEYETCAVDDRPEGHTTRIGCRSRGLLVHPGWLVRTHGGTSLWRETSGWLTCTTGWLLLVALCLLIAGVLLLFSLLNGALKSLCTE